MLTLQHAFIRAGAIVFLTIAFFSIGVQRAYAQGAGPIVITRCLVLREPAIAMQPFWQPFGPYPFASLYTDGIRITYVSNAAQKASRVAFLVNYRGDIQHIIDVGTFSRGATIDHTFGQFTGDAWLGAKPNACRAVAIRFVDGTSWHRRLQRRLAGTLR